MRFAALALSLLAFSAVADEGVKPVVKWTLLDQHEQAYTLNDDAQVLLIARSMAAAKLLDAALKDQPAGYLETRHVVYVADIEKMPSLVKLVAVPAMRSARYRIMLDQDGRVASRYDGDRESVQWLVLNNGRVMREQRFTDASSLRQNVENLEH
ncbi:hypothetical protein [Pseudomonas sp. PB3P13]